MRIWCLVAVAVASSLSSGCDRKAEQPAEKVALAHEPSSDAPRVADDPVPDEIESPKEYSGREPFSAPQNNATRSAEQYLNMSGFSRDGLIQQLSSDAGDGYSTSDATAAVDSLNVNWDENAAKSASQYLSMSGFSCKGLVEQLSSDAGDKYTLEQATYGAREAGAC